ncbi:hypothetical protein ABZS68_32490 [Streptomyces sp. NPDC005571]|uniref:hypothetical protein n=1 Tax=unclassified Streptomyces TaxID=2593676 RepID=UPI0033A203BE
MVVGATLAVGSLTAWLIGNRYQRIANDPPRDDFDQVTESFARLLEDAVPAEEPHATVHRLAANQVLLCDTLSAMLVSLERFDGAVLASDADAANRQAEAVHLNAHQALSSHETAAKFYSGAPHEGANTAQSRSPAMNVSTAPSLIPNLITFPANSGADGAKTNSSPP